MNIFIKYSLMLFGAILLLADCVRTPRTPAASAFTQSFHGMELATAFRTTNTEKLPDLWKELPKGSRSFEIRKDVAIVYSGLDGVVYQASKKKCFYIQSDPLGSSTMTFFGPFPGDPTKVLDLEMKPAVTFPPASQ